MVEAFGALRAAADGLLKARRTGAYAPAFDPMEIAAAERLVAGAVVRTSGHDIPDGGSHRDWTDPQTGDLVASGYHARGGDASVHSVTVKLYKPHQHGGIAVRGLRFSGAMARRLYDLGTAAPQESL